MSDIFGKTLNKICQATLKKVGKPVCGKPAKFGDYCGVHKSWGQTQMTKESEKLENLRKKMQEMFEKYNQGEYKVIFTNNKHLKFDNIKKECKIPRKYAEDNTNEFIIQRFTLKIIFKLAHSKNSPKRFEKPFAKENKESSKTRLCYSCKKMKQLPFKELESWTKRVETIGGESHPDNPEMICNDCFERMKPLPIKDDDRYKSIEQLLECVKENLDVFEINKEEFEECKKEFERYKSRDQNPNITRFCKWIENKPYSLDLGYDDMEEALYRECCEDYLNTHDEQVIKMKKVIEEVKKRVNIDIRKEVLREVLQKCIDKKAEEEYRVNEIDITLEKKDHKMLESSYKFFFSEPKENRLAAYAIVQKNLAKYSKKNLYGLFCKGVMKRISEEEGYENVDSNELEELGKEIYQDA
jgi:hypothetical protein